MKNSKIIFGVLSGVVLFAAGFMVAQLCTHSHPKMTKVKLYQAWVLNSEQLNKKLLVTENLEGSCWTSSNIDPRPDAWRCMAGNRVLDPCFSANPLAKTVACTSSPRSKKVSLMHLTKALPISAANSDDFVHKNPWVLVLSHHQVCYPIGGATFGFAGMRNDYSCTKKGSLLFGPVTCDQPYCQVFYYRANHSNLRQVPVKEKWY